MHAAEIRFPTRDAQVEDVSNVSHAVNALLAALRNNGQIGGREWPIVGCNSHYSAYVLLPAPGALDRNHNSRYVDEATEKLADAGLGEPEVVVIGEDIESLDLCACRHPVSYVLYTNYLSLESPLRCGDCFLPVPLYDIPPTDGEERHTIVFWQSEYVACETLWMNSHVLERSAYRQLHRVDSSLSRLGMEVCEKIRTATDRQVYYYLMSHGARSLKREIQRRCPRCGGEWLLDAPWHNLFDFRCDRCALLSNISWDVRPAQPDPETQAARNTV